MLDEIIVLNASFIITLRKMFCDLAPLFRSLQVSLFKNLTFLFCEIIDGLPIFKPCNRSLKRDEMRSVDENVFESLFFSPIHVWNGSLLCVRSFDPVIALLLFFGFSCFLGFLFRFSKDPVKIVRGCESASSTSGF